MHVVVIVERVQEIDNFFAGGCVEFRKALREITDFRGGDIPARGF